MSNKIYDGEQLQLVNYLEKAIKEHPVMFDGIKNINIKLDSDKSGIRLNRINIKTKRKVISNE